MPHGPRPGALVVVVIMLGLAARAVSVVGTIRSRLPPYWFLILFNGAFTATIAALFAREYLYVNIAGFLPRAVLLIYLAGSLPTILCKDNLCIRHPEKTPTRHVIRKKVCLNMALELSA